MAEEVKVKDTVLTAKDIEKLHKLDLISRGDANDALAELERRSRVERFKTRFGAGGASGVADAFLLGPVMDELNEAWESFLSAVNDNERIIRGLPTRAGLPRKEGLDATGAMLLNSLKTVAAGWQAAFFWINAPAKLFGLGVEEIAAKFVRPELASSFGFASEFGIVLANPALVTRSFARLVTRKAGAELAGQAKAVEAVKKAAESDPRLAKEASSLAAMGLEFEGGMRITGEVLARAAAEAGDRLAAAVALGVSRAGTGKGVIYRVDLANGKTIRDALAGADEPSHLFLLKKHGIEPGDVSRAGFDVKGQFVSAPESVIESISRAQLSQSLIEKATNVAREKGTSIHREVREAVKAIPNEETRRFISADDDVALLLRGIDPPALPVPRSFREALLKYDELEEASKRKMPEVYAAFLESRGTMTVNDVLKIAPGKPQEGEKILGMFHLATPLLRDHVKVATHFARTGDPRSGAAFEQSVPMITALSRILNSTGHAQGQGLQIFSNVSGQYHRDFMKAVRSSNAFDILESGIKDDQALRVLAADIAKFDNEFQAGLAAKALSGGDLWARIKETYRAVLMLNPTTAARNFIGSTYGVATAALERTAGKAIGVSSDELAARIAGGGKAPAAETLAQQVGITSREVAAFKDRVDPLSWGSEVGAFHRGLGFSLARNLKLLRGVTDEQVLLDSLAKTNEFGHRIEAFTTAVPGRSGRVLRTGTRATIAVDGLVQRVLYDSFVAAEAERAAASLRLTGKGAQKFIANFIDNAPQKADLHEKAIKFAQQYSFTAPLGPIGDHIQRVAQESLGGSTFFLFPFFRTPVNIFKFGIERTPLGFLSRRVQDELRSGDPARMAQAQGELFIAQAYFMAFWQMATSGMITPSAPLNPEIARLDREAGVVHRSLKIGDVVIPADTFEPLSQQMVAAADIAHALAYSDNADEVETGLAAFFWTVFEAAKDNTWLRTAASVFDIVESAGKGELVSSDKIKQALQQPATSVIGPPVIAQIARTYDPIVRDANTFIERITARWPALSTTLKADRNVFGEPIKRTPGLFWKPIQALLPLVQRSPEPDPDLNYLRELGINPPGRVQSLFGDKRPEGALLAPKGEADFGVPLSDDDENEIARLRGEIKLGDKGLRGVIAELRTDPENRNLPITLQRTKVQSLVNAAQAVAKAEFTEKNPQRVIDLLDIKKTQGGIRLLGDQEREEVVGLLDRAQEQLRKEFLGESPAQLPPSP